MKTLHYFIIVILTIGLVIVNHEVFADNVTSTEWNVQHVIGKFLYSNPPIQDQIFNLQYRVVNGTLGHLTEDQYGQFIAKVQSTDQGTLELKIPRNYPYSNIGNPNSNRSAIAKTSSTIDVNGIGIDSRKYSFVATDCFLEYSIPFSGNAIITLGFMVYPEHIAFHGDAVPDHCISETTVIPEFPLAISILLVSFVSVIVFYRMRFRE